ncbi:LEM domain-containing protein 2 [Parasteatoda tepidariorum]|uniref:LEM domain-containing protein 2 n=1 Tax=Parasteatoda tepidariorum TaxID=114398 RepID=UPI00077FA872|nr:LEM domain-containing protein 2 [Parasteatoda tepidariorum]
MDNSLIVEGFNIAELSDEELAERLQTFGFNPGPILDSTRSVYQRKLVRLMRNEDFEEAEAAGSSDVDEEVRPSPILSSTLLDYSSSSASSFSVDDLRRRPLSQYDGKEFSNYSPTLSPQKPWSPSDIVSQVEPPPGEMEKPLISPTAKIVAVCFLLLFVFLVYYNMEAAPTDPFSKIESNV